MMPIWHIALASGLAAAQEPPALGPGWRWDGPRTYALELALGLPEPLVLRAEEAGAARVEAVELGLIARCEPGSEDARGWLVACTLDRVSLVASAARGDDGAVGPVVTELAAALEGAAVGLAIRRDGRVERLVVEGLPDRKKAQRDANEALVMLLGRAFAGLDLALPPDVTGMDGWSERGSAALAYLERERTMAAGRVTHVVEGRDGDRIRLRDDGRAVARAASLQLGPEGGGGGVLSLTMATAGTATFDLASGGLVDRDWQVYARVTPSALFLPVEPDGPYTQSGRLRLLLPGDVVPTLPVTGERAPDGAAAAAMAAALPGLVERLDRRDPLPERADPDEHAPAPAKADVPPM